MGPPLPGPPWNEEVDAWAGVLLTAAWAAGGKDGLGQSIAARCRREEGGLSRQRGERDRLELVGRKRASRASQRRLKVGPVKRVGLPRALGNRQHTATFSVFF